MIQRIQTLYLIVIAALMTLTLVMPIATFMGDGYTFNLYAFGLKTAQGEVAQPTVYMAVVLILSALLPLVTIFLFKRRLLQIRLLAANIVLLLGSLAFMLIYYFLSSRLFSELTLHEQSWKITLVFPVISLIFAVLAVRAVFKDEILIRSADRIR